MIKHWVGCANIYTNFTNASIFDGRYKMHKLLDECKSHCVARSRLHLCVSWRVRNGLKGDFIRILRIKQKQTIEPFALGFSKLIYWRSKYTCDFSRLKIPKTTWVIYFFYRVCSEKHGSTVAMIPVFPQIRNRKMKLFINKYECRYGRTKSN